MKIDTVVKIYEMLKADCESKKQAVESVRKKLPSVVMSCVFCPDTKAYDEAFKAANDAYNKAAELFNDFANTEFQL